jgi:S1-C subfamily serine protease
MKMTNKLVLGILILLVFYAVGVGFYNYNLNQNIDRLGERFSALEAEQTNRLDALDAGLVDLQNETLDRLGDLEEKIEESLSSTGTIQEEISGVSEEILDINSGLGGLDERITQLENELAESGIDPEAVFEQVSAATVRISDGEFTRGSGVIMDTESHVITAQHVIDGMTEIYVVTYDGLVSKATLVGECGFSDIAVLELDKDPGVIPPTFADSSLIVPGAAVLAIGSPWFDIDDENKMRDTLTAGIISQVNRNVKIDGKWIPNLLQFDAPVNFGNSGGPLYNADGEIAGIVVARILPTEGDGIYFAVSANKAKRVAEEIIENGFFDHPWLGVIIEELLPEEVYDLGLETGDGVYVNGVFSGSPAEDAGITAGDIIMSVNGVAVRNIADLTSYLAEYTSPGDTVILEMMRDDTIEELSVEIGSREQ